MATISNLDVNLIATTKKFDSRIEKSGRTFGGFAKRINRFSGAKFAGAIGVMAGAVAGILSVNAALGKVNAQFDRIDQVAKFSDSVGGAVQDMQAMGLQAELTGTSQSTLEKGIQRLTRVLGDARSGNAAAIASFSNLGLSVKDFDGLGLADQVGLVSDRINSGKTAADRASAAYRVFGRQGQEMMTFFAGGSAGIQDAANEIDRFGLGMSRVDAAQVEMANDAFTKLNALTSAVFQKIAVEAAPILTAVVEMFTDASAEAGGWGGIVETGFGVLVTGIGFAIDSWNVLSGAVNIWRGNIVQAFTLAVRGLEAIQDGISYLTGKDIDFGITGLADELQKEANKFYDQGVKQIDSGLAGKGADAFRNKIDEVKDRAQQIADAAPEIAPKVEPKPVDWGKLANGFGDSFMGQLQSASDEFERNNPAQFEKPEVSVAAARSAAAQSIINRQRQPQDKSDPSKVIRDSANAQIKEMTKQTGSLDGILSWLQDGNAVVVPLNS